VYHSGFFGPVPGSLLRQIGRGYTDLTSALLAVGLQASELQIWKEVDGIFTADPRKIPTARLIPIISPNEAAELTYYGSEVIHPFTMEQVGLNPYRCLESNFDILPSKVIRRKIPIRIKNVKNPLGGGTVIYPDPVVNEDGSVASDYRIDDKKMATESLGSSNHERLRLPTAVTIKENIVVLSVHSNRKTLSHGFLAKIFDTLDQFGVVVDLISTSEVHVSMAIEDALGKRTFDRLVRDLKKSGPVGSFVLSADSQWLNGILDRSRYNLAWQSCRWLGNRCVKWSEYLRACLALSQKATLTLK
jgi:aspartate kinase